MEDMSENQLLNLMCWDVLNTSLREQNKWPEENDTVLLIGFSSNTYESKISHRFQVHIRTNISYEPITLLKEHFLVTTL